VTETIFCTRPLKGSDWVSAVLGGKRSEISSDSVYA
jgi:phage gp45-like